MTAEIHQLPAPPPPFEGEAQLSDFDIALRRCAHLRVRLVELARATEPMPTNRNNNSDDRIARRRRTFLRVLAMHIDEATPGGLR